MRSPITRSIQKSLLKKADDEPVSPVVVEDRNAMISGGLNDVAKAVLLAGGLGVGLRGLQGLGSMFGRPRPSMIGASSPSLLEIPHPVYENRADAMMGRKKKIMGAGGTVMKAAGEGYEEGLNPIGGALGMYKDPYNPGEGGFLSGHGASPTSSLGKTQMPWYIPAIAGGGLAAGLGGYKVMDWLMNKKRKSDLKAELDDARTEFHGALMDEYDPNKVKLLKAAGAGTLAGDLDRLADLVVGQEKRAEEPTLLDRVQSAVSPGIPDVDSNTVGSLGGAALGGYGALLGLTGLGSGYLAHQYFSKTDPNKALATAIKAREAQRWATRPPEVFAVPVAAKRKDGHLVAKDEIKAEGV